MKKYGFDTEAIHGAGEKDQFGALTTPIYNSSTFISRLRSILTSR